MTPAFLVTIDTEGDDLWARPRTVTTENARFLPRFQALCERFGIRPVYLVNWEMAHSPPFQELGRDLLRRGRGEIGMHLHGWNNPPLAPLTADDFHHHPYLVEYPVPLMREKIRAMTGVLEDTFGARMVSHRAGRWGMNEAYARSLAELGYRVDCSVTPHVSWRTSPGDPRGQGGPDYTGFPDAEYFLDLDDISRPGSSGLLEVPVTIVRPAEGGAPSWLRPNGGNREAMLQILRSVLAGGRSYAELMLHSSELMPGGSPRFRTPESIELLYEDLEALFWAASGSFRGSTLAEFYASR